MAIRKRVLLLILLLVGSSILSFLLLYAATQVVQHDDGTVTVVFASLLPLKTESAGAKLTATSVDPRQKLKVKLLKTELFKIAVSVQEQKWPKGNPITIRIEGLPTLIPGITKTFTGNVLPKIRPEVLEKPPSLIGTRNALRIRFNTPIQAEKAREFITCDFPADISPQECMAQNKVFTDYSSWEITPHRPLINNHSYRIAVQRGLESLSGETLAKPLLFHFATVPELKIVSIHPKPGSSEVPLTTGIKITANRNLDSGQIVVGDYTGETAIHHDRLSFTPARLFLPDSSYQVKVHIRDPYGEVASAVWNFQTIPMGERIWIEVNLRIPQTVTVYRGKQILRVMKASGGKSRTPTPRGTFRIYDRGYAFYSYKFREGAFYWLRFSGPFLIHSVPFGPNYRIKNDEAAKLGQPSSHGCIRLSLEDAKWLHQNVTNRTLVMIHGSPEPQSTATSSGHLEGTVFFKDEMKFGDFQKANQRP